MFGITQSPAKQTATDAINILSGRLQSATLLEDRRNAVLGLRSFSRQYPASVASGALRGLIGSLGKDSEDVDTVKIVLETLILLFNPDENSPEASEEIALWLADEFTQRQENITILLDLLDANDFYSRLYSLQLLSAINRSRSERTEDCIFTAPLGISRLVAILDDRREAIRNEGLSLLTYLTPSNADLQKLVAFENAFDRIFAIIKAEGSLSQGGSVVEDCLILLSNLLRMNISNQSYFRETACVPKLALLLSDALVDGEAVEGIAEWAKMQRNRNLYAMLAVIRLFLVEGGVGTQANQASFWQHGILYQILQLAFSRSTEMQIKAEALVTCADLIRGNSTLQEGFAQLQVMSVLDEAGTSVNEQAHQNGTPNVYVIDALLDLTLSISSLQAFDARLAACGCIKAYFYGHAIIRLHFLRRAIGGHTSGADETANVLTALLRPLDGNISSDPYRYWMAAVLVFHLVFENPEAKALAMSVSEGDANTGEEVVTCIQTISSNLVISIQQGDDERVLVAYLMLLCGWLFEDPDGVNDFLGEGSNVQSLVQTVLQGDRGSSLVQGLCALLLGIIYEFSTKDSPIPRATLHPILASRMGRELYIDRLTKLRRHPLLRDFEVLPQKLSSAPAGGLPEVYFDKAFADFFKDNFSRMLRAIDRDPGMEIPVISNGIQKGISREMVDSLRSQIEEKDKASKDTKSELLSLGRQLEQERAGRRKDRETAILDLARIKNLNDALQRHHEDDIKKLREDHALAMQNLQAQLEHVHRTAEGEAARIRTRNEAEITDLQSRIDRLEADLEKANKNHVQDLQTAHQEYTAKLSTQNARLERAEDRLKDSEDALKSVRQRILKSESLALQKEAQREAVQSELDDLLIVFGDVEETAAKYKNRLKNLGETVSDGEEEEKGEDEHEGDETEGDAEDESNDID